jgi:hypothetical protein
MWHDALFISIIDHGEDHGDGPTSTRFEVVIHTEEHGWLDHGMGPTMQAAAKEALAQVRGELGLTKKDEARIIKQLEGRHRDVWDFGDY